MSTYTLKNAEANIREAAKMSGKAYKLVQTAVSFYVAQATFPAGEMDKKKAFAQKLTIVTQWAKGAIGDAGKIADINNVLGMAVKIALAKPVVKEETGAKDARAVRTITADSMLKIADMRKLATEASKALGIDRAPRVTKPVVTAPTPVVTAPTPAQTDGTDLFRSIIGALTPNSPLAYLRGQVIDALKDCGFTLAPLGANKPIDTKAKNAKRIPPVASKPRVVKGKAQSASA